MCKDQVTHVCDIHSQEISLQFLPGVAYPGIDDDVGFSGNDKENIGSAGKYADYPYARFCDQCFHFILIQALFPSIISNNAFVVFQFLIVISLYSGSIITFLR